MAWIESHQDLVLHPKMKKLKRRLGISTPEAVGYLHMFWWWAMDFADDGDISKFDEYDIADACEWQGDAEVFFDSLHDAGFIDATENGYEIHDWYEYAGRMIELRKKDAERKRNSRGKKPESSVSPEDVQRTSSGQRTESEGNLSESIRNPNPNPNLNQNITTTTDGQIQILNLYCSLHNKMEFNISAIDRNRMLELANSGIPLEFILEHMKKIHEVRGDSIRGFGYYSPIIQEAWKNSTSPSIPSSDKKYSNNFSKRKSDKPSIAMVKPEEQKASADEIEEIKRKAKQLDIMFHNPTVREG